MEQKIEKILNDIIHPETGRGLVDSGMVASAQAGGQGAKIVLRFRKTRDPFQKSVTRQVREALATEFSLPDEKIEVSVESPAADKPAPVSTASGIKNIIAVASGKGGVGKSTVTANLAVAMASMGYKVGILDADIYGPSQPRMFGTEGFLPQAIVENGVEAISPAVSHGVKLMSIGYFIKPDDALVWRGPMATGALKQLIHQTDWGRLDYLFVDLPPGTGDVHLTVLGELKVTGAVIVSTPQQVALADVRRGIAMFRAQGMQVPVLGIIENMAWFTPQELPDNRYYIFGKGGAARLAHEEKVDFLGEVPLIMSVMEGAENGCPAALNDPQIKPFYEKLAVDIIDKTL